jgi:hypothetical protein
MEVSDLLEEEVEAFHNMVLEWPQILKMLVLKFRKQTPKQLKAVQQGREVKMIKEEITISLGFFQRKRNLKLSLNFVIQME